MIGHLMPYGGPTRSTQIIGRVLNVLSYVLALLVGLGDLLAPTALMLDVTPRYWLVMFSGALVVTSGVGVFAVTIRRWRIEWVTATIIAFLLLARSVPVWDRIFIRFPENTSIAAMMALGAICLAQRALNLWIFAIRTLETAEQSSDGR